MNPAPNATKYCRYLRSQAFWTMAAPPRPLAAAAVRPSRMLIVTGFMETGEDSRISISSETPSTAEHKQSALSSQHSARVHISRPYSFLGMEEVQGLRADCRVLIAGFSRCGVCA